MDNNQYCNVCKGSLDALAIGELAKNKQNQTKSEIFLSKT